MDLSEPEGLGDLRRARRDALERLERARRGGRASEIADALRGFHAASDAIVWAQWGGALD